MTEIDDVLRTRDVHPVFQPIVDLATGEVVAVEALARGPAGPLHGPDALLRAARATGRLAEVDLLCRTRAVETALGTGLAGPAMLFVNAEPPVVDADLLPVRDADALRERGLRLVVELTERALMDDPGRLLAFADHAHEQGWAIALDDVGADPGSLALMPFLRPDVIKLDLSVVQRRPDPEIARIMTAVNAHAEESGAVVLAEGVETEAQEREAHSLGATLAQGWRYGRPADAETVLPRFPPPVLPLLLAGGERHPAPRSPFEAVTRWRPARRGTKDLLLEVTRLLEDQAKEMHGLAVILATFQVAPNITPATERRYADLAEKTALVVALGEGMSHEPLPGLRGAALLADDPVLGEWDVAVVGPHFAAALVARDLEVPGVAEGERPFDYVLTHDRTLVLDVARSLMGRALPAPGEPTSQPTPESARESAQESAQESAGQQAPESSFLPEMPEVTVEVPVQA